MRFHFPEYEPTDKKAYIEAVRRLTPQERFEIVGRLWSARRNGIRRTLRDEFPDWSEVRLNYEVAMEMSEGVIEQADQFPLVKKQAGS